jgi:hypothetical protein
MTPGQQRWLEKLRDRGPQERPRYGAYPCVVCHRAGWADSRWEDAKSGEVLSCDAVAERGFQNVRIVSFITEAGLAALNGEFDRAAALAEQCMLPPDRKQ